VAALGLDPCDRGAYATAVSPEKASEHERRALRRWLAEHPSPTGAELADAGYVAPHWPEPWGRGADAATQLAIDEELAAAGVSRPINPIGIGWAGPTILAAGTSAQRDRWLPRLLSGEDFWCQLFSEPSAGSDLAALSTRAVRDADEWVVTGSKIWTSFAHVARFGILLARTDPNIDRHQGITYFVCPMDAPGITIRPVVDMTGDHAFNEVFFDEVRISGENVIGEPGDGWRLAKVTLANERVSLTGGGLLWGWGPSMADLLADVRSQGGAPGPVLRDRLVGAWIRSEVIRMSGLRQLAAALAGQGPGPTASVRKALADNLGQEAMDLAMDLAGPEAQLALAAGDPMHRWTHGFLYAQALTIGGGTSVVQRNIIAEHLLGLPKDPVGLS